MRHRHIKNYFRLFKVSSALRSCLAFLLSWTPEAEGGRGIKTHYTKQSYFLSVHISYLNFYLYLFVYVRFSQISLLFVLIRDKIHESMSRGVKRRDSGKRNPFSLLLSEQKSTTFVDLVLCVYHFSKKSCTPYQSVRKYTQRIRPDRFFHPRPGREWETLQTLIYKLEYAVRKPKMSACEKKTTRKKRPMNRDRNEKPTHLHNLTKSTFDMSASSSSSAGRATSEEIIEAQKQPISARACNHSTQLKKLWGYSVFGKSHTFSVLQKKQSITLAITLINKWIHNQWDKSIQKQCKWNS